MSIIRAAQLDLRPGDLAQVAGLFSVGELSPIGGFENALFRSADGQIVRLTHHSRRPMEMIEAELAFMQHLADQGVTVVAPLPSTHDRMVESVGTEAGDEVLAIAMAEAPGGRRPLEAWGPSDIEGYGALLAKMHVAATTLPRLPHRPPWTDPVFDVGLGAPGADAELAARNEEIRAAATAHPAGAADLLIHQDAHHGNLFITDDGVITIFDFDDCAYGTPTHDIAIVLFYWVLGHEDPPSEARRFLDHFLTGYRRLAELPADWSTGVDLFLSYREIDIYWLVATEDPGDSSAAELRFMKGRRQRILSGVPYLGVPLAEL